MNKTKSLQQLRYCTDCKRTYIETIARYSDICPYHDVGISAYLPDLPTKNGQSYKADWPSGLSYSISLEGELEDISVRETLYQRMWGTYRVSSEEATLYYEAYKPHGINVKWKKTWKKGEIFKRHPQ
jgi:hypothetical protein